MQTQSRAPFFQITIISLKSVIRKAGIKKGLVCLRYPWHRFGVQVWALGTHPHDTA